MHKKNLIMLWSRTQTLDNETHKVILSAPHEPEYILAKAQLGDRITGIINELNSLNIKYIVVNDLHSVNDIYSLVSYLRPRKNNYSSFVYAEEMTQFAASIIVREIFDRENDASCILIMKDKRLMKQTLGQLVSMAPYISLVDAVSNKGDRELSGMPPFPVVVKPVNSAGSDETYLIQTRDELFSHMEKLHHPAIDYIVEGFVDGDEYNVDAIWENGKAKYFFVGKYIVPRLRGHYGKINKVTMYLPLNDYKDLYGRLEEICTNLMESIGYENGITHAEFFINGDKIVLGEIAARQAGGGMSAAIRAAVGEGLFELGVRSKIGTLHASQALTRIHNGYFGFVELRPSGSGTINSLIDKAALMAIEGIVDVEYHVNVGDFIEDDDRLRSCVLAIISGRSKEEFSEIILEAKSRFYCVLDSVLVSTQN